MRLFFQFLFSIVFTLSASLAVAETVIVITDSANHVTNIPSKTRVIELDKPLQLHEKLSANLPSDPEQATKIAKTRLATTANELQKALQDVVDAWALGVAKLPAVVVGKYVVYGVTDVTHATALIHAYQAEEQHQ